MVWFGGLVIPEVTKPGSEEEARAARLGVARVVRYADAAGGLGPCPVVPEHEVGPNRPPVVPWDRRQALSLQAQWVAYLFDYFGLWPAMERTPGRSHTVRDCGPVNTARSRRYGA